MVSQALAASFYLITTFTGQGLIQKKIDLNGNVIETHQMARPSNLVEKKSLKIILMGDTGCRLKGKEMQNCLDKDEWPLEKIAASISQENADFVIHVGDYHYRESCTDTKKCGPFLSAIGYTWAAWKADWFEPTRSLNHFPFVFVRGNHENCNRAWEHWQKYLSPVEDTVTSCRRQDQTQFIDLPGILLVNGDLGWLNDDDVKKDAPQYIEIKKYLENLKIEIIKRKKTDQEVWVLFHPPAYGAVPYREKKDSPIYWATGTPKLLKAIEETGFNEVVDLYISGHIHNAQVSQGKHPLQVVVGESGTKLEPVGDYAKNPIRTIHESKVFLPTGTKRDFGYMTLELSSETQTKTLIFKDTHGQAESVCSLRGREAHCENLKNF